MVGLGSEGGGSWVCLSLLRSINSIKVSGSQYVPTKLVFEQQKVIHRPRNSYPIYIEAKLFYRSGPKFHKDGVHLCFHAIVMPTNFSSPSRLDAKVFRTKSSYAFSILWWIDSSKSFPPGIDNGRLNRRRLKWLVAFMCSSAITRDLSSKLRSNSIPGHHSIAKRHQPMGTELQNVWRPSQLSNTSRDDELSRIQSAHKGTRPRCSR